jgi:hypothetical protein
MNELFSLLICMKMFKAIHVVLWHSSGKSLIVLEALVWNVKRLTLTTARKYIWSITGHLHQWK